MKREKTVTTKKTMIKEALFLAYSIVLCLIAVFTMSRWAYRPGMLWYWECIALFVLSWITAIYVLKRQDRPVKEPEQKQDKPRDTRLSVSFVTVAIACVTAIIFTFGSLRLLADLPAAITGEYEMVQTEIIYIKETKGQTIILLENSFGSPQNHYIKYGYEGMKAGDSVTIYILPRSGVIVKIIPNETGV